MSANEEKRVTDRYGDINIPKLFTFLTKHKKRNEIIKFIIDESIEDGRVSLFLSERVEHVKEFHKKYKNSGIIHGSIKGEKRQDMLNNFPTVFAIAQLARDGLDRKDLDTVLITCPMTDKGRFEQIIGRAQRVENPIIIIFEDNIEIVRKMCSKLKSHLRSLKYPFTVRRIEREIENENERRRGNRTEVPPGRGS
jgi:superfamily II DNA or RNA helicase